MPPLRCGVEGCRAIIRGLTGLQEATNVLNHLNRVHAEPGFRFTMKDALELRARWEETQESAVAEGSARKGRGR